MEVVAFAAAFTEAIGSVPAVGAIHAEPFHPANQLASAGFASHGRAGWVPETTDSPTRAGTYGATQVTDPEALHREADEVTGAVRCAAWSSSRSNPPRSARRAE